MTTSRRSFFGLIGGLAGAVIAPRLPAPMAEPAAPIFVDGDVLYRGVILREVNYSAWQREIFREYVKANLFSPYMAHAQKPAA